MTQKRLGARKIALASLALAVGPALFPLAQRASAGEPAGELHAQAVAPSYVGSIERLYEGYFLRAPDAPGLAHWSERAAAGLSVTDISRHFASSREFKIRYGSPDTAEFLRLVYGNILDRAPDPSGFAYWTARIEAGLDHGSLMLGFTDSTEFRKVFQERKTARVRDRAGKTPVTTAPPGDPGTSRPPTTQPPTTQPPTTQPPTTQPPTTQPPTTQPPVSGTRDARLWPFRVDSPWNTPLGSRATFEGANGRATSRLRATSLPSKDGSTTYSINTWVNTNRYSHPIYQARTNDPLVHFDDRYRPDVTIRVPAHAVAADGNDRHLHVLDPSGRYIDEFWMAKKIDATHWTSGRHHRIDLTGDGLGPDGGVRAYGGSAIGGLIRTWEVDPTHPEYTDGVIRHPLALAVPSGMLQYTGGRGGYTSTGYGTALGYVWPATEQDHDSPYSYYGTVPMGTLAAIPPSVDIDSLGLNKETRAIAKALQDYGGYITDRTTGSVSMYAEADVPSSWRSAVTGPSFTAQHLQKIRQQLQVVTNNRPDNVGGGGTPRAPKAPPIG